MYHKLMGLVLVFLFLFAVSAQANTCQLGDSGWTMVVNKNVQGVDIPYTYGVQNNALTIEIDKTFSAESYDGQYYRPTQIEFVKTSDSATSKIIINDEYIVNNSGREWGGFDMYLMVNMVNPMAGFNPNVSPSGDQLENVFFSENYGYNGMPIQLSFADNNGHGVVSLPIDENIFMPGYVVGAIEISINPDMPVGSRFGLKEIPVNQTPEPMTLALLGMGGLFLVGKNKKK
jgi:hypothetical protein